MIHDCLKLSFFLCFLFVTLIRHTFSANLSNSLINSSLPAVSNPNARSAWQSYLHRLNRIQIRNQRASSLLSPFIAQYEFKTPEVQLRRGLVYTGFNHRLRTAVKRGMERKQLSIGVIGGSISFGTGTSKVGETDWVSIVEKWAVKVFGNVTVRNGCIPGTLSAYMAVCLDMSVDQDVDIVFSEYVLNDGKLGQGFDSSSRLKEHERLVRRVLSLPHRPPLIFLQTCSHGLAFPEDHRDSSPFHDGIEEAYGILSQYYDVQWLSLRTASYRLARFNKSPEFSWQNIMNADFIHPADFGHKIMADLVVWLFHHTATNLMLHPLTATDTELAAEELPPPMFQGNLAPSAPMCMHFEALQALIVSAQGFEFVVEGPKKKKGFVGLVPGSNVTFKINTDRGGGSDGSGKAPLVLVQIGHLKSYEHMGKAKASCSSGCTCDPIVIDGHHSLQVSQTYLASLMVSQHPECYVTVEVLKHTSSGQHKVKIIGIMISDTANPESKFCFQKLIDKYDLSTLLKHLTLFNGNREPSIFERWREF
ncbi:hypothetical protein CEUSTIGMA_g9387.t1 [Chlamydomonas eustigma]|uniref:SGNH hydrolase-type esterase domain-containing protein n=1 Tax=Chlamydomonas eustigma TaxID=1157962 RepID=A0A250XGC4_9CHLO|nr:hypothetical protein CEUSTIGMA_g9387.t1 [Chlamydomonas eustigma]|eukprot:GAX81959.1 hypothetical protein CEUSTIGMA_g9387.t1 [Chlamydomonas eustigma]